MASTRWVFLTVISTSLVHLVLHVAAYALVLRHVFRAYPAGPAEFVQRLQRSPEELVIWAMVLTTFSMGWFITIVMRWSGVSSIAAGLKRGIIIGLLFWTAVNSGLYASSRHFSLPSVLADTPMSALCMAFASAFAVWMLSVGSKTT